MGTVNDNETKMVLQMKQNLIIIE